MGPLSSLYMLVDVRYCSMDAYFSVKEVDLAIVARPRNTAKVALHCWLWKHHGISPHRTQTFRIKKVLIKPQNISSHDGLD